MYQNSTAKKRFVQPAFFLIVALLFSFGIYAQTQITAKGRVVDASGGNPVIGASVLEKGTTNGTVTDVNGDYSLKINSGSTIVISYTGFLQQELLVNSESSMTVTLVSQTSALSEVVVIGYGERRRKDVTGAISSMGAKEIEKSTSLTPEMAMQGRLAGVLVSTPSGEPNARPSVRIRGVNTFGYAEPLYVVDGIPLTEGGQGVTTGAVGDLRTPINIFTLINPNDIESISVLKDASAAAIYGVRASNGVILITTKRGKTGRPKVSFSGQFGFQNIPKTISTLNTQQYVQLYQEAYNNNPNIDNGNPVPWPGPFGPTFDPSSSQYLGNSKTYDWQKEIQNKNASIQDYNVSLSGGTESTNYFMSAGYGKTESPLKQNNLERYSIAANVNSKISKWLEAGLSLHLAQTETLDNTQTDLGNMITAPPWQPIYDPNDPTGMAAVVTQEYEPNSSFDPSLLNPGPLYNVVDGSTEFLWGPATRYNPFGFQVLNKSNFTVYRTLGNAYVTLKPLPGLSIKGSLGGDFYYNIRHSWGEYDAWRFSQTPGNPYSGHDGTAVGSYGERHTRNYNLVKDLTANYKNTFYKDHNIDVTVSAVQQEWKWNYLDVSSGQINYTDPFLRNVPNIPPYVAGFTGTGANYALIGYMGRLSYNYAGKYYLDVTVRRDGSSRFAPDYRWGTFPSFAAAWRLTDENFMNDYHWLTDLKIRGGWGELGNEQTTNGFAYLSGVGLTPDYPLGSGNGDPFGNQVQGARLPNFPNNSLTWEKIQTTNIGFDAVFINKINLTLEYYNKRTKGIIQSVTLPPNAGIESAADLNIAEVTNRGIEIEVGYNDHFGPVQFNASANFTTVKNNVEKLYQGTPLGGETGRIQEGYPLYYLWGYQVGGIFQSQADIDKWRSVYADLNVGQAPGDPSVGYVYQPGDMYFVDLYGNPVNPKDLRSETPDSLINSYDRTYLGKTIPGFYYGFNFGANWAGFDISVFFQGVGDVQKYNGFRQGGEQMSSFGNNQWVSVLNRWTAQNPSNSMPRAVYQDPASSNRFSSRWIEDAGFMRLKNLQVGYSLPKNLMDRLGFVENFRVYITAVNLFTLTSWSGLDPENDFIPPTRQILFGLNANF